MSRVITITEVDGGGFVVIEDGQTTGVLGTGEALEDIAIRLLHGRSQAYPRHDLGRVDSAFSYLRKHDRINEETAILNFKEALR
jgi:hypothetical protein